MERKILSENNRLEVGSRAARHAWEEAGRETKIKYRFFDATFKLGLEGILIMDYLREKAAIEQIKRKKSGWLYPEKAKQSDIEIIQEATKGLVENHLTLFGDNVTTYQELKLYAHDAAKIIYENYSLYPESLRRLLYEPLRRLKYLTRNFPPI